MGKGLLMGKNKRLWPAMKTISRMGLMKLRLMMEIMWKGGRIGTDSGRGKFM